MLGQNYGAFGLGTDSQGRRVGADPRYNAQALGLGAGQQLEAAQLDYANAQQAQQGALGMYQQMAMGQGPSAAGSMLQQGHERAQANAAALAHQTRGGSVAGASRDALAAQHAGAAQANHAAMQQAAMEQQAAMQGYAGLGMQMGGQAQQQQQMQMAQQQGLLGMQFGDDAHRREMDLEGRKYKTGRNMGWTQYGTNTAGSILGGLFGGG